MNQFYLYRLKVERIPTLFPEPFKEAKELIREAVLERPRAFSKRDQQWLIGNVQQHSQNQLFFAFGKISKAIQEKYDTNTKNFTEVTEEHAPYTFVAIDLNIQVCAIGYKAKIAQKISTLGDRLVDILNTSKTAQLHSIEFVLPIIPDTESFINTIKIAEVIKKFELTFSLPNPWDVEEDFHKPQEEYLKRAGGKTGKTTVAGENLNKSVITETVKSIAATGNTAAIRVKLPDQKGFMSKKLSGNQVSVVLSEPLTNVSEEDRNFLFKEIDRQYREVRQGDRLSYDES